MSYILKALKRSESERGLGQAPEFRTVLEPEPLPERRPKRWLLIGALLLANVLLLIGLLIYQHAPEEGEPAPDMDVQTGNADIPKPALPEPAPPPRQIDAISRAQQPGESLPQRQLQAIADAAAVRSTAAQPPLPAEAELAPQQNALPQQDTEQEKRAAQAPAEAELVATAEPVPVSRPLSRDLDSGVPPPEKKTPRPPPKAPPAMARLPDLPSETVRDLPGILMSVHVYARDPARRFVYINGQRQREGDEIVDNRSTLEAITEQGVIFDFGNRRVLLQVER